MPRVFLSRDLRAGSPFQRLRKQAGWQLEARALLRFTPVEITGVPGAPWLFFYSARGVEFFLARYKPLPEQRLACLGPAAARVLRARGYVADYVGNGVPTTVATELQKIIGTQAVAFLQARHSRASVQRLLAKTVSTTSVVVYDNQPISDFELLPADYLIFTSPLNFQAYCRRYPLRPEQRLIGIGTTTGETFTHTNYVNDFQIASRPDEQSLLDCVLNWERDDPINLSDH